MIGCFHSATSDMLQMPGHHLENVFQRRAKVEFERLGRGDVQDWCAVPIGCPLPNETLNATIRY